MTVTTTAGTRQYATTSYDTSSGGGLANTGFDVGRWVAAGLLLVGAGTGLTVLRRRPKH